MIGNGIESFFNNPGQKCEIKERLLDDLYGAKKRIFLTAYSLSAENFVDAINDSPIREKYIILNENIPEIDESVERVVLNFKGKKLDFIMHNKFIIIDNVVWTGSFNLSINAIIKNWENMIRIEDEDIANKYASYFKKLYVWGQSIDKLPKIFSRNQFLRCEKCDCEIMDIFEHYQIQDHGTEYSYECVHKLYPPERLECDVCHEYKKLNELVHIESHKDICINCYFPRY